jgi:hypothetical protein
MAELLRDRWPVLAAQIETALRTSDEPALADLVGELRVVKQCDCGDEFCQSFYTAPPPAAALAAGHRNLMLEAPWPGFLILDLVDDKIVYVEVLDRPPLD